MKKEKQKWDFFINHFNFLGKIWYHSLEFSVVFCFFVRNYLYPLLIDLRKKNILGAFKLLTNTKPRSIRIMCLNRGRSKTTWTRFWTFLTKGMGNTCDETIFKTVAGK